VQRNAVAALLEKDVEVPGELKLAGEIADGGIETRETRAVAVRPIRDGDVRKKTVVLFVAQIDQLLRDHFRLCILADMAKISDVLTPVFKRVVAASPHFRPDALQLPMRIAIRRLCEIQENLSNRMRDQMIHEPDEVHLERRRHLVRSTHRKCRDSWVQILPVGRRDMVLLKNCRKIIVEMEQ
jgi:hypothetical protein